MSTQNSEFKTQNDNSNLKTNLKYRSFQFSLKIISFVGDLPHKRVFWVIGDQLLRAATSIGANIIEAKSSGSRKEFIRYYEIALKSANEATYWLELLKEGKLMEIEKIRPLISEIGEIANMLGSSLLTLKRRKI